MNTSFFHLLNTLGNQDILEANGVPPTQILPELNLHTLKRNPLEPRGVQGVQTP
jgi:hypothetical protein